MSIDVRDVHGVSLADLGFETLPDDFFDARTSREYRFHVAEDILRASKARPHPVKSVEDLLPLYDGVDRVALYVHVPWCVETCTYCYYYGKVDRRSAMQKLLNAEFAHADLLDRRIGLRRKTVSSIYFGGGTPTVLPADLLEQTVGGYVERYAERGTTEVCVEGSISSLTPEKIELLERYVTRLSIGVQSFNDRLLKSVARSFSAEKALGLLRDVVSRFASVNIDLIFGLRNQSFDDWLETIDTAIALEVPSLTLYRLEFRVPGLIAEYDADPHSFPDEILCRRMRHAAKTRLLAAGYRENLIGWFLKPKVADTVVYRERWQKQTPCVALGPHVHNYGPDYFYYNDHDPNRYLEAAQAGRAPITEWFAFPPPARLLWFVMAQWKSNRPISYRRLVEAYGDTARSFFQALAYHQSAGLLGDEGDEVAPTEAGKSLIEWILRDLIDAWLPTAAAG